MQHLARQAAILTRSARAHDQVAQRLLAEVRYTEYHDRD